MRLEVKTGLCLLGILLRLVNHAFENLICVVEDCFNRLLDAIADMLGVVHVQSILSRLANNHEWRPGVFLVEVGFDAVKGSLSDTRTT